MTQFFDTSGDTVTDTITLDLNGDTYEEVTAYDRDQNGVFEAISFDSVPGDGDLEMWAYDDNQNGQFERAAIDQDNTGALETFAVDTNGDEVVDTLTYDYTGEAASDLPGDGVAYVGPATNPSAFVNLMGTLAKFSGQATFGTPDSDYDSYPDNIDHQPYDRRYY